MRKLCILINLMILSPLIIGYAYGSGGQQPIILSGTVSPPGIGSEVHVRVRSASDWSGGSVKADEQGRYSITLPGPGSYTIHAMADGYASETVYIACEGESDVVLDVTLLQAGAISGKLVGQDVHECVVYAQRDGVDTDPDGLAAVGRDGGFQIRSLKPGRYSLIVSMGYRPVKGEIIGELAVKGVSPRAEPVDPKTQAAIEKVLRLWENAFSSGEASAAIPLLSKNYSCGARSYEIAAKSLEAIEEKAKERALKKGIPVTQNVPTRHYVPVLVYQLDGRVEAVCSKRVQRRNETTRQSVGYELFRFVREDGRWLVKSDCPFAPYGVPEETAPVVDKNLADILVEAGKTSSGYVYELPLVEKGFPPDPGALADRESNGADAKN